MCVVWCEKVWIEVSFEPFVGAIVELDKVEGKELENCCISARRSDNVVDGPWYAVNSFAEYRLAELTAEVVVMGKVELTVLGNLAFVCAHDTLVI